MGFGGSAGAMNAVIKNNRNLLKKRKRENFSKRRTGFNLNQDYQYPKASAKQLRDLRLKIKDEHKQRMIKIYLLLSFILSCVITIVIYFA